MDRWPPVHKHSPWSVSVPQVMALHDSDAEDRWVQAASAWVASGSSDYSVWGDYADLVRAGRLQMPTHERTARRFAEYHVALLLERSGFTCWGGVYFFRNGKRMVAGKGPTKVNTVSVKRLWQPRWLWPQDVQETLAFEAKNPDLVAYHRVRGVWRFCEVKGRKDSCSDDHFRHQLRTLAVLHLLTDASVAVIRTGAAPRQPHTYRVELAYNGNAAPDWAR